MADIEDAIAVAWRPVRELWNRTLKSKGEYDSWVAAEARAEKKERQENPEITVVGSAPMPPDYDLDREREWTDRWMPQCFSISAWCLSLRAHGELSKQLWSELLFLGKRCDALDQVTIDRICWPDRRPILEGLDWMDLTDRQQEIIRYLAGTHPEKRTGKQIASHLGTTLTSSLKGDLAQLVDVHVLDNVPGSGYWVRMLPRNTPAEVAV